MDIKHITAEMEIATRRNVFCHHHIQSAKKEVETDIRRLGKNLNHFTKIELYNEYKNWRANMLMASPISKLTVDILVERIIKYFVNSIVVSVNNKDKIDIDHNTYSHNIT